MSKMVKCKYCGKYIAKSSKICQFCKKRQKINVFPVVALYFGGLIGLLMLGEKIFPRAADGSIVVPDWYLFFWFFAPIVIAALYASWVKRKAYRQATGEIQDRKTSNVFLRLSASAKSAYDKKVNPNNEFIVPKGQKRQKEIAKKLLETAKADADLANKEDNIQLFIMFYDSAIKNLEKMAMLEKSGVKDQAERDVRRLKSEIQWHLCDALVRQKEKTISEIRGKYKNSKEFQVKQYESFKTDIEEMRPRFSQDTADFAEKCLREVGREAGVSFEDRRAVQGAATHDSLTSIDFMEGHQFEHWCAALLQKIGFVNVEVTQGSGDQGVDVLAEKDGIKYAIQCKCYSSDLGNKPIQEVNTGKAIYHCQIGAVITNRYFTQGGKEAATATGVLLWDRDWIREKLKEVEK